MSTIDQPKPELKDIAERLEAAYAGLINVQCLVDALRRAADGEDDSFAGALEIAAERLEHFTEAVEVAKRGLDGLLPEEPAA